LGRPLFWAGARKFLQKSPSRLNIQEASREGDAKPVQDFDIILGTTIQNSVDRDLFISTFGCLKRILVATDVDKGGNDKLSRNVGN
jgi:hypothetical protein